MANFGLDDLRLVNPREGWPRIDEYREAAYAAAAGAAHLLDAARVFDSVEAAVARSQLSSMPRPRASAARSSPSWRPSPAMAETRGGARARSAAFCSGPSAPGSTTTRSSLADAILTFPANPAYASLNLAQAVLLVGYEWFKAAHGDAPPPQPVPRAVSPPAEREMVVAFFEFLERQARRAPASSVPSPRSRACGATCATSSTACR